MKNTLFFILCICLQFNQSFAQSDQAYLESIEGITNKMLDFISMDIGEQKDWDEYRNLFLPTSQKFSISNSKDGTQRIRTMNLEEFVRNVGPLYSRDGFEEYAIGLEVNEFNGIANAFQSFYCRNLIGTYEKRGVNSFQLVYLNDRWWIVSTIFVNESKEVPLPDELLFREYQNSNK